MAYSTITVTVDDRGVATLTLARPEKHNALNAKMMEEITTACAQLSQDDAVRAVILAAAGKTFCAGADLNWMKEQLSADRAGKIKQASVLANMLRDLDRLPKPVIGRVEGNAFGGGIGLMAVCDIVVAKNDIKLALTETKLGLIPATIGPFVLRCMSETYARQVFFTAKPFSTDFALRSGLISVTCTLDEVDAAVEVELEAILTTQPKAVAAAKALLQDMRAKASNEEIRLSITALADCWETDEAQTQISAFLKGKS